MKLPKSLRGITLIDKRAAAPRERVTALIYYLLKDHVPHGKMNAICTRHIASQLEPPLPAASAGMALARKMVEFLYADGWLGQLK